MPIVLLLLAAAPCDSAVPLKRAACERKAGHPVKALEIIDDFLLKRPKDKKSLKLREQLQKELVLVEWFSEPEGALVALDGEELGPTPITLTLDPGRHAFKFTRDGYQPLEREENAVAGTHPKLTAVLERIEGAAPVAAAEPVPPAAPAEPIAAVEAARTPEPEPAQPVAAGRKYSSAPLIIGTTGIFLAIGGGVLTLTSFLTLSSHPGDANAVTRQYVGYALAGVGAALGVGAIIWLLLDRRPGAAER